MRSTIRARRSTLGLHRPSRNQQLRRLLNVAGVIDPVLSRAAPQHVPLGPVAVDRTLLVREWWLDRPDPTPQQSAIEACALPMISVTERSTVRLPSHASPATEA